MKIYECKICKRLAKNIKKEKRFRGTRKMVRKHLVEIHHIKGGSGHGYKIEGHDQSEITKNMLSEEWK